MSDRPTVRPEIKFILYPQKKKGRKNLQEIDKEKSL